LVTYAATFSDFEGRLILCTVPGSTPNCFRDLAHTRAIGLDTVSRLAGWFGAALHAPEVRAKLISNGIYPALICGAEYASYLRQQYDECGRAIRAVNIRP
jgi:hypothetical protein